MTTMPTSAPNPESRHPRAIIYTRVSTTGQVDTGTSLAEQLVACTRKAEILGALVIHHFEDAGISGALYESRSSLQKALQSLERGEADTLIIANLSRFSRDQEHQSAIKKRVERARARIVFCDVDFADTPEGNLQFGILGNFAEYERHVIRARTMNGRRKRASEGIQPCRVQSPYGYHIVTKMDVAMEKWPEEQLGRYQIIEAEAVWVRTMFERANNGHSLRAIASFLNTEGAPLKQRPWGASRVGKTARAWGHSSVYYILTNPVHKGSPVWGQTEAMTDDSRTSRGMRSASFTRPTPESKRITLSCPAIVRPMLWESVNERLVANKTLLAGNPRRRYLLSGFLRCPVCAGAMNGKTRQPGSNRNVTDQPITAYECAAVTQRLVDENGERTCRHGVEYPSAVMETLFADGLGALVSDRDHVSDAIRAHRSYVETIQQRANPAHREAENLQRELESLDSREKATITAQIASVSAGASPLPYIDLLREITDRRSSVRRRLYEVETEAENDIQFIDPLEMSEALAQRAEIIQRNLLSPHLTVSEKRLALDRMPKNSVSLSPIGKEGLRVNVQLIGKSSSLLCPPVQIIITCSTRHNPTIAMESGRQEGGDDAQ